VPSDGDYIVVVVVVDADAATRLCLQGVGRNCSGPVASVDAWQPFSGWLYI
jgi:hypothetical protein